MPSNLELMTDSWDVIWFRKKVNWSGAGLEFVSGKRGVCVWAGGGSDTWNMASSNEFEGGPTEMSDRGSVRA